MCALNADTQYHEMISHLGYTHLAMEPVIISFHSALTDDHLLLRLMFPFFKHTLAINHLGRSVLLKPGGAFDEIMSIGAQATLTGIQLAYAGKAEGYGGGEPDCWGMHRNSFPEDMKRRGFPLTDDQKMNIRIFLAFITDLMGKGFGIATTNT
eukprot:TRINITY_DN10080_c1_g1_i1.p1 TRINITY_DN10080_c1_g1~~TRINITY_DN10080_c1_g1_i1.p1  ORF type:complete len:153 (-),score=16.36 TRINITY_DN10080_c1_g1_i1:170-628(-)